MRRIDALVLALLYLKEKREWKGKKKKGGKEKTNDCWLNVPSPTLLYFIIWKRKEGRGREKGERRGSANGLSLLSFFKKGMWRGRGKKKRKKEKGKMKRDPLPTVYAPPRRLYLIYVSYLWKRKRKGKKEKKGERKKKGGGVGSNGSSFEPLFLD